MIPDREEDIRPRFHKSKTHSQKHMDDNAEVIDIFYLKYNSVLDIILQWIAS